MEICSCLLKTMMLWGIRSGCCAVRLVYLMTLGWFHCMSPVTFVMKSFISGYQLHIFIGYQFFIMSSKRSRALTRFEDLNTSPNRVQNEQFVDDSQRKSKKTEKSGKKSNRPLLDKNVSVLHHSKRSKEKSLSKKRSRSCSRSSRRKRSHLHSPRPGPSC